MTSKINVSTISKALLAQIEKDFPDGAENTRNVGQVALDAIGEYPLYASTSGVTYQEAIAVALVLNLIELK